MCDAVEVRSQRGFTVVLSLSDSGTRTELWLVSEYHELGSLFEYLNRATIDRHQLVRMAFSIVSGLVHLHTEINGANDCKSNCNLPPLRAVSYDV